MACTVSLSLADISEVLETSQCFCLYRSLYVAAVILISLEHVRLPRRIAFHTVAHLFSSQPQLYHPVHRPFNIVYSPTRVTRYRSDRVRSTDCDTKNDDTVLSLYPQQGDEDAEIRVPSVENPELTK